MATPLNPMIFPLHGTRLIEASAGTGKTYTIASLYLRLILGHGGENGFLRPLSPPEILVVTFTNAATEELRERIRSRLTQGAGFFRGMGEGDDFLIALKADYDPESWPAMAMRLDQAAQWMDEAAIHTIHAWCQRMLRQHAFDSLSLFDLELAPSDRDLQEEASCDFWRARFYPLDPDQLFQFKTLAGISTPQELLAKAQPLINAQGEGALGNEIGESDPFKMMEIRQAAIDGARQIWASGFDTAVAQVEEARAAKVLNNNKYRKPSLDKWHLGMDLWVNRSGPLPDDQTLEKFSAAGLAAGAAKNQTPPVHPAYDALDELNARLKDLDIKTALICHAAQEIHKRTQEAKERLSRMGFNDLLTRLGQALSRPETQGLARVIHDQFPVAMIDEFQDTDPVQYKAFSTIYLDREDAGLFMIGDPKQAIYAFRGADIHTYLTAREDTQGRHYTLEKNYRSTQGMVAAVNQMFGRAAGFDQGAFLFKDNIPFDPVLAQGRSETLVVAHEPQPSMTLWQMDQEEPVAKTGPEGYISRMAGASANEIARLINLGAQDPCGAGFLHRDSSQIPLKPSDIAVLVRDGREAAAIRKALEKRRVKSVYLSDRDSVFDSDQALSLLYLLRACADPGNEARLRTALAVPILGLSFARLDQFNRDETAWEAQVQQFREFKQIWQTRGILPMLRALLARFNVGARLLAAPSGEREMTNVLHLAEMLQTAAASLDGEQGLIRWLAGQIEDSRAMADDQILRLESDDALVRVVTIHKSKGLEYPLVFLPFICSFRKMTARNTAMAVFHDDEGGLRQVVNPDSDALARADQERLAEDLRMLYVALTRPCHACWLGLGVMGKITKSGETTDLHQSALGYLIAGGENIPTAGLGPLLSEVQGDCEAIVVAPLPEGDPERVEPGHQAPELSGAREFTALIPRNWRITSYSGILAGAAMAEHGSPQGITPQDSPDTASQDQLMEAEDQEILAVTVTSAARSIHTFPRGPEPGTFLHDILEWAAVRGFDQMVDRVADQMTDRAAILEEVSRRCARRGWEAWSDVLTDWLTDLVQCELVQCDPGLDGASGNRPMRLADLTPELCRAEMEFMFPAHGVNIRDLDRRVTAEVLPGIARPSLRQDRVNGMLKGFIDLVFCFEGQYFVLDYKSNHLGDSPSAYGQTAMAHAMAGHRYDLQYLLYTLALHRLLKSRLDGYEYDRDIGGAVYLFLRGVGPGGQGIYRHKPPKDLILALDQLFRRRP